MITKLFSFISQKKPTMTTTDVNQYCHAIAQQLQEKLHGISVKADFSYLNNDCFDGELLVGNRNTMYVDFKRSYDYDLPKPYLSLEKSQLTFHKWSSDYNQKNNVLNTNLMLKDMQELELYAKHLDIIKKAMFKFRLVIECYNHGVVYSPCEI